jgi:hypothetical protein
MRKTNRAALVTTGASVLAGALTLAMPKESLGRLLVGSASGIGFSVGFSMTVYTGSFMESRQHRASYAEAAQAVAPQIARE